mmetsp:Transcript_40451/g.118523  ORF Transcript_40451/g.118523 Transcript_40451/m.118523 type:complete len:460 (+) Transcript_40451:72-1451(+)
MRRALAAQGDYWKVGYYCPPLQCLPWTNYTRSACAAKANDAGKECFSSDLSEGADPDAEGSCCPCEFEYLIEWRGSNASTVYRVVAPPSAPPPPLPPLETALAPVASEQPLPLARRLARVAFYALRAAYLWLVFSPLLLSSPLAFWQRRFPQLEEVWWSWCIATLERTGALAIKLAQWASSRPDLFSSRVCGRLQHLQDHTQPHSLEATEAALDAAFGPGWRSVLRIAPHPVGSGCIAQVHRGELLRDGEWGPVAVKVLHPQVGRYIRADGALLRLVCGGLQRLPRVRWLNPGGMSEEFTEMLLRQLDLRRKKKADSPRSQEHTCPPHPVPTRAPLGARRTTCAASAPTSRARGAVPRRSTSRIRSAGTWRGPSSSSRGSTACRWSSGRRGWQRRQRSGSSSATRASTPFARCSLCTTLSTATCTQATCSSQPRQTARRDSPSSTRASSSRTRSLTTAC